MRILSIFQIGNIVCKNSSTGNIATKFLKQVTYSKQLTLCRWFW